VVAALLLLVGRPALYLLGTALYSWSVDRLAPLGQLLGLVLLGCLVAASPRLSSLQLGFAAIFVVRAVAIWDTGRRRVVLRRSANPVRR
jgi:low temperature requirement protein LtrA